MKSYDELDKRLALVEQKIDLILTNHLKHMEKDMAMIKWFLAAVMLAIFGQFLFVITAGVV